MSFAFTSNLQPNQPTNQPMHIKPTPVKSIVDGLDDHAIAQLLRAAREKPAPKQSPEQPPRSRNTGGKRP